jgi:hypothetical protein
LIYLFNLDPGIIVKDNIFYDYDLIERNDNENVTHIKSFNKDRNNVAYCDVCEIYQYPNLNIRHCDDCDCCILGHDHHCPWMGKCVGKKNMKWFIIFNCSWIIYVTELLIVAWL